MSILKNSIRLWIRRICEQPLVRYPTRHLARVGVLPNAVWKRLPVVQTFHVVAANGASFQYTSSASDSIGRSLYWKGLSSGWETETVQAFQALAIDANLILDIGANTGVYTLLACAINPNVRVVSFEPVPRIHQRLMNHIELNGWQSRCKARNEAVSNSDGNAVFHIPDTDLPTSASLNPRGFRHVKGTLIEVPLTTVDAVSSTEGRVDLVKIDVEGFEDKVLEGMQATLAKAAPTIIFECNPDGPYQLAETILRDNNYSFFHLQPRGPVAIDRIVPESSERYRNYLGVARDIAKDRIQRLS